MSVSETKMTRLYHQEDIQKILNLAIAHEVKDGEFDREHLVEIAAELGISPQRLQQAEQAWLIQQQEQQKRQEFDTYRGSQLKRQVGKYVIVNTFLVALNLVSAGQISWALYILLFWGLGLGLNSWHTYQLQGQEYEQAFQKWDRKQQLNQLTQSIFTRINNWLKTAR